MILVGLGANLASPRSGPPRRTLAEALAALAASGVEIRARSNWYRSEPVPRSGQPWFVNAVAALATRLDPFALLAVMQSVEAEFGRSRGARNAARAIDLDLLDYEGQVIRTPDLILPHPRLHERRFVLLPLAEIAPGWRHPTIGSTAVELLARLADDQPVELLGPP